MHMVNQRGHLHTTCDWPKCLPAPRQTLEKWRAPPPPSSPASLRTSVPFALRRGQHGRAHSPPCCRWVQQRPRSAVRRSIALRERHPLRLTCELTFIRRESTEPQMPSRVRRSCTPSTTVCFAVPRAWVPYTTANALNRRSAAFLAVNVAMTVVSSECLKIPDKRVYF